MKATSIYHSSLPKLLSSLFLLLIASVCLLACKKQEIKSNEKEIILFSLAEQTSNATIDKTNRNISSEVKYNTNLKKLCPTLEVSVGATSSPASGDTVDFSNGTVNYTVTAEDNSSVQWKVSVTKAAEIEKKLLTFVLDEQNSPAIITDSTVTIEVVSTAVMTALVPKITISSGATISPASGTKVDFSKGPVTYTITATDGSIKAIRVIINRIPSSEKKIISISIPGQIGEAVPNKNGSNYTLYFPITTDFTTLVPTITISDYATISPQSGIPTDFSKGYVDYKVTAEDGSSTTYKIYTEVQLIGADNSNILYVGRMDFTTPTKVKFSGAGAYIQAKFTGTYIEMVMGDGSNMNFVQVVIDNQEPIRLQMMSGKKTYKIASGLANGEHTILICKDTEGSIGSLEFYGFHADGLIPLTNIPTRKMECYGNSITVGAKMLDGTPCDLTNNGTNWNAANSAYYSYGAVTARALNAEWQIQAWSGIGLIQSCCGMTVEMPDVYDRLNIDQISPKWDFTKYTPDVVTICLGQNDGATIVASEEFKNKYVAFIASLREKYPNASIFCVTSPMADATLLNAMNTTLQAVVDQVKGTGDSKVYKVELPHGMGGGCAGQGHPSQEEHAQVAVALEAAIKEKMGW
jgi:lysophospholipase L1-like esterase